MALSMESFVWSAYSPEVVAFDLDDFVPNGQLVVDQDMSAYPPPSLGTGLVEGQDDQVRHQNLQWVASKMRDNL